jgi:hypothetical protein
MNKKYSAIATSIILFLSFSGYIFAANSNSLQGQQNKEEAQAKNEEKQQAREESEHGKSGSVEIQSQNNKLKIRELNADDEIVEESTDSGKFDTDNEDDDSLEIKANGNASLVIKNKLAAQTNFPLRVNLETNELIVNTPKGSKVVTVLPDAAVANMLAANVLDQIGGKGGLLWIAENPTATPSATPVATTSATPTEEPTATPSGEPESLEKSPVQLVLTNDGVLAYEIEGAKFEKLLGLFKVKLNRVVFVSAETGELISVNQNLLTKLLDLVSF